MSIPKEQRVPNQTLRGLRLSLRMSQNEFAQAIRRAGQSLGEPNTCTKRLVQKWESGEHNDCRPNYRRALEKVIGVRLEEMGFRSIQEIKPIPTLNDVSLLLERSFALSNEPGTEPLFRLSEPAYVEVKTVSIVEASTARLFDLEHHQPARLLLPTVKQHLQDVAILLTETKQPFRYRLATSGGQAAALAGWLSYELGDPRTAHYYWGSALTAAKYASNRSLLSCIFVYLSMTAAEQGDPCAAWQLSHSALINAEGDPRAEAWMRARIAQEAATLNDAETVIRELKQAIKLGQKLTSLPPYRDDKKPWLSAIDSAYIWAMASNAYLRLHRPNEALEASSEAIDVLGPMQTKARAVVLAEAAHATLLVRQKDLALKYANEAIDLAEKLEATHVLRQLRLFVRGLPKPLDREFQKIARRVKA